MTTTEDIPMPSYETQKANLAGHSAVLPVKEVVDIVREWVDLHARSLPDFAGAYLWGGITALPGKHQSEYDQVVVAAIKGTHPDPTELYQRILDGKANPRLLTAQPEPLYKLPAPPHITRFVFAPDIIDEEQGLRLIQEQGAWKTNGFQALLEVPRPCSRGWTSLWEVLSNKKWSAMMSYSRFSHWLISL
jgi:hypothetical protein